MFPRFLGIGLALALGLALPAAAQLTAAGPDLKPGASSPFNGVVKVKNFGTATAGASYVTVECQRLGGGSCPEASGMAAYEVAIYPGKAAIKVPALKPGKTFTHKLKFWNKLKFRPGTYEFTIIADDGDNVAETNEGNNTVVVQKIVP